jgi:hypothetical protein
MIGGVTVFTVWVYLCKSLSGFVGYCRFGADDFVLSLSVSF